MKKQTWPPLEEFKNIVWRDYIRRRAAKEKQKECEYINYKINRIVDTKRRLG